MGPFSDTIFGLVPHLKVAPISAGVRTNFHFVRGHLRPFHVALCGLEMLRQEQWRTTNPLPGLPESVNFFLPIMIKKEGRTEGQSAITTSEVLKLAEQVKVKVELEDDTEARPKKKAKAAENPNSGQYSQQNSNQKSQQESDPDLNRKSSIDADANSRIKMPFASRTKEQMMESMELRKIKLKFLERARATRPYYQQVDFWKTSPFKPTASFNSYVEELDRTQLEILGRGRIIMNLEEEEKREKKVASLHSARALGAGARRRLLGNKIKLDTQLAERYHRLLERTVREEFERELNG